MEPAEQIFLNLIDGFTVEDIKYAIGKDVDLARLVQEELPDYLEYVKGFAKTYIGHHPDYKEYLRDPKRAAQKVVAQLKIYKPVLGYEIELYRSHPTTSSTGFKVKGQAARESPQDDQGSGLYESPRVSGTSRQVAETEHVGYAWVASNLVALSELLLR